MTIAKAAVGTNVTNDSTQTASIASSAIDTTGCNGLIFVLIQKGATTTPTIADSKSNSGWTHAGTQNANPSGQPIKIDYFYCANPTSVGAGHTATASWTTAANAVCAFYGCTGCDLAVFLDSIATNANGSTAPAWNTNSLTPSTLANGAILVAAFCTDAGTETAWSDPSTGFTIDVSSLFGAGFPHQLAAVIMSKVVTSGSGFTASATDGSTGASDWAGSLMSFIGGAGGGGGGTATIAWTV